jgi:Holliday junction resolvasome RuvABC ATP-dependent DNA helicase subunit
LALPSSRLDENLPARGSFCLEPLCDPIPMFCSKCGLRNLDDARECARCGELLVREPPTPPSSLRFKDIVGQRETLTRIRAFADLYHRSRKPIGHILIFSNDGSGKRTIGQTLSGEYQLPIIEIDAEQIRQPADLATILLELGPKGVLLLARVNKLRRPARQALSTAMRQFKIATTTRDRSLTHQTEVTVPSFTCVGTAGMENECQPELLDLFQLKLHLSEYSQPELHRMARTLAWSRGFVIDHDVAAEIALAGGGRPGEVQRLVSHLSLLGKIRITMDDANRALSVFGLARSQSTARAKAVTGLLQLSPRDFEKRVAELLGEMGFRVVELTKTTGDGGIDIVAVSDTPITGGRYLVQCKRFGPKSSVGSPLVREFYGALKADRRAVKGILITTSRFTPDAKRFAAELPLELIDGERLGKLLSASGKPNS